MTDFIKRIAIPGLDKLPGQYIELGLSYRGANPEGTARWVDIEEHARQPGAPAQPLRTPNTFAKVETITVPTLILVADADLYAPQALMRIWAAHIRHHEWVVIDDAGHSVPGRRPERSTRRCWVSCASTEAWLSDRSGPSARSTTPCILPRAAQTSFPCTAWTPVSPPA